MKSDVEKLRVLNKLVEHYGYQNGGKMRIE